MKLILKSLLMNRRAITTKPITILIALACMIAFSKIAATTRTENAEKDYSKYKLYCLNKVAESRKTLLARIGGKYNTRIRVVFMAEAIDDESYKESPLLKCSDYTSFDKKSLGDAVKKAIKDAIDGSKSNTYPVQYSKNKEEKDNNSKEEDNTSSTLDLTIERFYTVRGDEYAEGKANNFYIQFGFQEKVPQVKLKRKQNKKESQTSNDKDFKTMPCSIVFEFLAPRAESITKKIGKIAKNPKKGTDAELGFQYDPTITKEIMTLLSTFDIVKYVTRMYGKEQESKTIKKAKLPWKSPAISLEMDALNKAMREVSKKAVVSDSKDIKEVKNYRYIIQQKKVGRKGNILFAIKMFNDPKKKHSNSLATKYIYDLRKYKNKTTKEGGQLTVRIREKSRKLNPGEQPEELVSPDVNPSYFNFAVVNRNGSTYSLANSNDSNEWKTILEAILKQDMKENKTIIGHKRSESRFASLRKDAFFKKKTGKLNDFTLSLEDNTYKLLGINVNEDSTDSKENSDTKKILGKQGYEHEVAYIPTEFGIYTIHRIKIKTNIKNGNKNKKKTTTFFAAPKVFLDGGLRWEEYICKDDDTVPDFKELEQGDKTTAISWLALYATLPQEHFGTATGLYKYQYSNSEEPIKLKIDFKNNKTNIYEFGEDDKKKIGDVLFIGLNDETFDDNQSSYNYDFDSISSESDIDDNDIEDLYENRNNNDIIPRTDSNKYYVNNSTTDLSNTTNNSLPSYTPYSSNNSDSSNSDTNNDSKSNNYVSSINENYGNRRNSNINNYRTTSNNNNYPNNNNNRTNSTISDNSYRTNSTISDNSYRTNSTISNNSYSSEDSDTNQQQYDSNTTSAYIKSENNNNTNAPINKGTEPKGGGGATIALAGAAIIGAGGVLGYLFSKGNQVNNNTQKGETKK